MSRESDIYIFTLKLKHCWGTKNGGDLTEGKAISNTEVHFRSSGTIPGTSYVLWGLLVLCCCGDFSF